MAVGRTRRTQPGSLRAHTLGPYDRKISLYKPIFYVLRVSHYFGRFLTNCALPAPFLGRHYESVSYLREILSDNDT